MLSRLHVRTGRARQTGFLARSNGRRRARALRKPVGLNSPPRWRVPSGGNVQPGSPTRPKTLRKPLSPRSWPSTRALKGKRPFTTFYLHKAAHSALVDEIRRRKRRQEVSLEASTEGEEETRPFEPRAHGDPESDASSRQVGLAIRTCLAAANRDRRLALGAATAGAFGPGRLLVSSVGT